MELIEEALTFFKKETLGRLRGPGEDRSSTSIIDAAAANVLTWVTVRHRGVSADIINISASCSYSQQDVFVFELYSFDKQLVIWSRKSRLSPQSAFQNSKAAMISGEPSKYVGAI